MHLLRVKIEIDRELLCIFNDDMLLSTNKQRHKIAKFWQECGWLLFAFLRTNLEAVCFSIPLFVITLEWHTLQFGLMISWRNLSLLKMWISEYYINYHRCQHSLYTKFTPFCSECDWKVNALTETFLEVTWLIFIMEHMSFWSSSCDCDVHQQSQSTLQKSEYNFMEKLQLEKLCTTRMVQQIQTCYQIKIFTRWWLTWVLLGHVGIELMVLFKVFWIFISSIVLDNILSRKNFKIHSNDHHQRNYYETDHGCFPIQHSSHGIRWSHIKTSSYHFPWSINYPTSWNKTNYINYADSDDRKDYR